MPEVEVLPTVLQSAEALGPSVVVLADRVLNCPSIGDSPIEFAVGYLTVDHCYGLDEAAKEAFPALTSPAVRYFMEAHLLSEPDRQIYYALRTAAFMDDVWTDILDCALRHALRWLATKRIFWEPENAPESFLDHVFTEHFAGYIERLDRDLEWMRQVAHGDSLTDEALMALGKRFERVGDRTLLNIELILLSSIAHDERASLDRPVIRGFLDDFAAHMRAVLEAPFGRYREVLNSEATRRSLKRAVKLFERMGKEHLLRNYLAGMPLRLTSENSPFFLEILASKGKEHPPQGSLVAYTAAPPRTVPFKLAVGNIATGEQIGRLCVFAEDTPVLDLLLAIILHADAGEIHEIVAKGNWWDIRNTEENRELIRRYFPELADRHFPEPKALTPAPPHQTVIDQESGDIIHWGWQAEPFRLETHSPHGQPRPPSWNPQAWRRIEEPDTVADYVEIPTADFLRFGPIARRFVHAWFAPSIARWTAIQPRLDEMIAVANIPRTNPACPRC